MQDDSPWKPPTDDAEAVGDADLDGAARADEPFAIADDPEAARPDSPWAKSVPGDVPTLPDASPSPPPLLPPVAPTTAHTAAVSPSTEFDAPSPASTAAASDRPAAVVVSSEPSGARRRSIWVTIGAAAAVVAVVAAGIFAITNLTGSSEGGAAAPEELGLALMTAIENEDVLGAIDLLSPGERDVFRDPIVDLVGELTRLGVLADDADLARIAGVDVEFSGESVAAISTNVDDITNIDIRADATVAIDGSQVPIGSLITDNVPADDLTELRGTKVTETEQLDVRLTAMEQAGRWYFSVFHTIAELARGEVSPGTLIPIDGLGATGSETPEAVVDRVFGAVEALDLTALVQTLNPGEAAALQRYAPLFIDDGQAALDEAPLQWAITGREFRVEGDGDTRTVLLDAITIDGMIEETPFSVSFADGCVRAEADGETFEQCQKDKTKALNELLVDAPDAARLIDTITEAFADIEPVGLELRQFDGGWYVSPTSTFTEGFLAVLRALDRSELDAIVDQAPAAFDEFGDAIFGGLYMLPGNIMGVEDDFVFDEGVDSPAEDGAFDDTFDDTFDNTFDDTFDDMAGSVDAAEVQEDPLDAAWSECYAEYEPDVATACFAAVSAEGGPDPSLMPIQLRFPECGYTQSWNSDFYQLPDDEFIAAAEAARPCFLDLVDQGAVCSGSCPRRSRTSSASRAGTGTRPSTMRSTTRATTTAWTPLPVDEEARQASACSMIESSSSSSAAPSRVSTRPSG